MPSSQNTSDIPSGEQLYLALGRKLKKAAKNTRQRKIASGEYVMDRGRCVPAKVLVEAEAVSAARILVSSLYMATTVARPGTAPLRMSKNRK